MWFKVDIQSPARVQPVNVVSRENFSFFAQPVVVAWCKVRESLSAHLK